MFASNSFRAFLSSNNIESPFYILIRPPDKIDFVLFYSSEDMEVVIPNSIPYFNQWHVEQNHQTGSISLWLKYPDCGYALIHFAQYVSLDNLAISILYHFIYPCFYDNSFSIKKTHFERIVLSSLNIMSSLDLNVLLGKILDAAIDVIHTANSGMLFVYDCEIDRLVCKYYYGTISEQATNIHLQLGEGLSGKAFLRKTPKLYSNVIEMENDITDYSPESKLLHPSVYRNCTVASAITMPVVINGNTECVLIVYQSGDGPPLSTIDVNLLTVFSEQIAIAITNARLFTSAEVELSTFKKCNDIYLKLTDLSLQNAGIERIIEELINTSMIPLVFVNLTNNELYPKNSRLPECIQINELAAQLINESAPVYLNSNDPDSTPYFVFPINASSTLLGFFIMQTKGKLSAFNQLILKLGGTVAALELVKSQSLTELYYRRTFQLFNELIQTASPTELNRKCNEIGCDYNKNYICVIFAAAANTELQFLENFMHRFTAKTRNILSDFCQMIFCHENKVTLLASLPDAKAVSAFKDQIKYIIEHTKETDKLLLCAGMGSLYKGATNIAKTFYEANKALLHQISRHHTGLIQYEDIGINQIFLNIPHEDTIAFLQRIFTPLKESPVNKDGCLERTLVAYIKSNCSIKQTAESLFIHPNTLYQRLKKIEDCLDLSFSIPEDLLQMELACYFLQSYPDFYRDSIF